MFRLLPNISHVTYIFALAAHAVGRVVNGGGGRTDVREDSDYNDLITSAL